MGRLVLMPVCLANDEPKICREINQAGVEPLQALCLAAAHVRIEEPVMVGVDPLGVDIRGRFDVFRVPFDVPIESADDASRLLRELMATSGGKDGSAS